MTTAHHEQQTLTLIGRAVLDVSGVAFLKPGLGDLLRSAAHRKAGLRTTALAPGGARGIRLATRHPRGAAVEVDVVLLRGHRAVDVTRAIRAMVQAAYPSGQPIPVRVTVTGIV